MERVTSQVLVMGAGRVDKFDLIVCLSNDNGPGTQDRSVEHRAHNLLKPSIFQTEVKDILVCWRIYKYSDETVSFDKT